jgi:hypothetical protein
MKLLVPIAVNDANLLSHSISENDYPVWSDSTTYALGDRVLAGHRVMESLVAVNLNGPTSDLTKWTDVGPTNRWAMFDPSPSAASQASSTISFSANFGAVNDIVLTGVIGTSVRVQLNGADVRTVAVPASVAPLQTSTVSITGLGIASGAVGVILTGTGAVSIMNVQVGTFRSIGLTAGGSVSMIDHSTRETDAFGVTTIVRRGYSRRIQVNVDVDTGDIDSAVSYLSSVRGTACYWEAGSVYQSMNGLGVSREWSLTLGGPRVSTYSLTVETLSRDDAYIAPGSGLADDGTSLLGVSSTVWLYQRTGTGTAPTLPNSPISYTADGGTMLGITNSWSATIPTGVGAYLWATTAVVYSQGVGTVIPATAWRAAALLSQDGATGSNGVRTAVLEMYRWAASAPTTFPAGTSTYTWSSGQFTDPATLNGWTAVPGSAVAGQTLWMVRQTYSDQGASPQTSVTWSAAAAYPVGAAGATGPQGLQGLQGIQGVAGQRMGFLEVYKWAASAPSSSFPAGSSTYAWADGSFTLPATPNGWSLIPGAAVAGQTLWGVSVNVSDNLTTATSSVTWPATPTAYAVGFAGANGANGTRTAILDMYQWAASAPSTFPSGSSSYNWATGQFTAPATTNGWALTPGTPGAGQTLYIARQVYSDSSTTSPTNVTWAVAAAIPGGAAGANGQRVGVLEVYQWAASAPAVPSGTSTYTWSNGTFTAPTTANGWSLTPSAAVPGQTLWGSSCVVSDNSTSATSTASWSGATAYAVGGAGTNGSNGANGSRTAVMEMYQWAASAPAIPSGTSTYTWATGQFTNPATLNGWAQTPPAAVAGQTLFVARKVYADTGVSATTDITWTSAVAVPAGAAGSNGVNGQRVGVLEVYQWAASAPTGMPSGTSTYTWSNGTFTAPTTPNGWALVPGTPTAGYTLWGVSVTVSNTSTSATDTVTWTGLSPYPVGAAGANGSVGATGPTGPRGTVQLARAVTGNVWSDAEAQAALTANSSGSPVLGDVVTLYNNSAVPKYSEARVRTASVWAVLASYINGSMLVDGTIVAQKIDSRGLSIQDASGNIILAAGSALDWANVGGAKPVQWRVIAKGLGTLGNVAPNGEFELLSADASPRPAGWVAYEGGYTLTNYWGWHRGVGASGSGYSVGLYVAVASGAGPAGGRAGVYTTSALADGSVTGGVAGGWQPNKAYTVKFKARTYKPAAPGSTSTITVVGSTTPAVALQSNSYTVALPSGSVVGDVAVLVVHAGSSTTSLAWTGSTSLEPAGSSFAAADSRHILCKYKVLTAGDVSAGSVTVTMTQSASSSQAAMLTTYRGVDTSSPILGYTWASKGSNTTDPVFPSLSFGSTLVALPVYVFVPGNTVSATNSVTWGSATATAGLDWAGAGGVWTARGTQASMSSTPIPTCDYSATSSFISDHVVFALRPASSGGTGETSSEWNGMAVDLFWNTYPVSATNVLKPAISASWQQYEIQITWGGSVEQAGRLFIGINNGAGSLPAVAVGTRIEFDAVEITTSSDAPSAALGLYNNGALDQGGTRSYMLAKFSRTTGLRTFWQTYDVFGNGAVTSGRNGASLAAELNATGSDTVVVVYTSDEPQTARLDLGLAEAMYRCGASPGVFGSSLFRYRGAYVLIGVAGCGMGNGFEQYKGAVDNDPSAWVDVPFVIQGGQVNIGASASQPRIDAGNASTYIANLAVNTLQIANDAVTLPLSATMSSAVYISGAQNPLKLELLTLDVTYLRGLKCQLNALASYLVNSTFITFTELRVEIDGVLVSQHYSTLPQSSTVFGSTVTANTITVSPNALVAKVYGVTYGGSGVTGNWTTANLSIMGVKR